MRTSKPIATISYNTQDYLLLKLNELIKSHTISDYTFIHHEPEEDEAKGHFHLFIKPNKLLDTMTLQEHFREFDSTNPTKPLGCIDFHLCNSLDDWFLYCQHFEPYLASKMEARIYHYSKDDFVYFDEMTFEDNYIHAFKASKWACNRQILEVLNNESISGSELIKMGVLPLNMACSVSAYETLKNKTYRNGRANHEGYFIDEYGEIKIDD